MPRGKTSAPEPELLRGTLFVMRRRCGKPNCRCASGDPHESPALAYPEAGRTGTMTLTGADLRQVRAALRRYERARASLDARADAGIARLRATLGQAPRPKKASR
jgi:hypothetical protein